MVNPQLPRARPSKKSPINAGFGSLDRDGANGLRIEVGRADAADDGIAEALVPHVVQTSQQQPGTDALSSGIRIDAGRAEEIATRGVMAGKAQQAFSLIATKQETG